MDRRRARRAFTLAELVMALAVLGVLWAMTDLSVGALTHQTARREAERVTHWLYGILLRADRTGRQFSLRVQGGNSLVVEWGQAVERLKASEGCYFSRMGRPLSGAGAIIYSPAWGTFTPALTLQVQGPGGGVVFLLLSGQGRLRITDSLP